VRLLSHRKDDVNPMLLDGRKHVVDEPISVDEWIGGVCVSGREAGARGQWVSGVAGGDDVVSSASKRTDHGKRGALFSVGDENPHLCNRAQPTPQCER